MDPTLLLSLASLGASALTALPSTLSWSPRGGLLLRRRRREMAPPFPRSPAAATPSSETLRILWENRPEADPSHRGLRERLRSAGLPIEDLDPEDCPGQAFLRRKVDTRTLLLAGGGRTMHRMVNVLADLESSPDLGFLPLGSRNDICRSLGIGADPQRAADALLSGHLRPRPLDLISVRTRLGRRFVANHVAGADLAPAMASVSPEIRARWGVWAYLGDVLRERGRSGAVDARIVVDGRGYELPIVDLVIANGRTMAGGVPVAPHARMDDGLLEVVVFPRRSRQSPGDGPPVLHLRGRHVVLETDPPLELVGDDQDLGPTPAILDVEPGRLSVLGGR